MLFDLESNIGETQDLAQERPDVVRRLEELGQVCRGDLGDGLTGVAGANCRPPGRVSAPRTRLPVRRNDELRDIIQAAHD